jgi:hypothetical protein
LGADLGRPEYAGSGDSGVNPDTPGLKAVKAIFCVRGYKSPLRPFLYPLLPFSTCKPSDLFYSLLYSPWLKFGEIVVGI